MSFLGGVFGGSSQKMCRNCGQKPVFQGHEYCGKTCAEWAKKNPPAPAASNWGPPPPAPGPAPGWGYGNYGGPPPPQPQQQGQWPQYNQYQQGPQQAPGGQMCQHCRTKPVYQGHQYCSKTCGSLAKQGAGPPPMPAQPPQGPQGYGGYPAQAGPWAPQGPQGPQQAWGPGPQGGGQWQGPPQGGGQWQGPPQRGGPAWGTPPQRNWNQGGPPRRRQGGYDDDDGDEWPDDDDEEEWDDEPQRPKRTSLAKKGTKMCMNCFQHPSVGKTEFCSKKCKAEAEAKLGGKGSKAGARRPQPGARRRKSDWDDID